jgi:hypothetical protein
MPKVDESMGYPIITLEGDEAALVMAEDGMLTCFYPANDDPEFDGNMSMPAMYLTVLKILISNPEKMEEIVFWASEKIAEEMAEVDE